MGHQLVQQAPQQWRTISSTKGPKFAVSSSKVPLTEYIAVTKRICDELGENTAGKGLYRNLPKNQGSSTTLQGQEGACP